MNAIIFHFTNVLWRKNAQGYITIIIIVNKILNIDSECLRTLNTALAI